MFDARRFCDEYSIDYQEAGKNTSEGWISLTCPMCDDSSNHGGFNLDGGYFYCWKCGGHWLPKIITALTGIYNSKPIVEKYDILMEWEKEELEKEEFVLPGDKLQDQHKYYLIGRGFNPDYIEKKYKVMGTLAHAQYPYRIITPVIYNGDVVSFLGRDFTGRQELRHKDCGKRLAKIHHKEILYNLDNCNSRSVIVVEGAYDVWRMGDNCCATLGTGWTVEQANILLERFDTIFIMFDKGNEAQAKAKDLAVFLNVAGKRSELIITDYDEPDDIPEKDIEYLKTELGVI